VQETGVKGRPLFATFTHAGLLSCLLFDPEDGGDMFHRNVGWLPKEYRALYPRNSTVQLIKFITYSQSNNASFNTCYKHSN
jgi:hypothetical protein